MAAEKTDKINKMGGIWNILLIGFVGVGGSVALAWVTSSITAYAIAAFMILGLVVALVSLLHMQLREREQMEALELDEIRQGATTDALFDEGEVLPAKRSREQFEKLGMPFVAILMFFLQAYGVYYIATARLPTAFQTIDSWMVEGKYTALFGAALMGLIFFLRGQFASNLARIEKQRFLQPASDYVLFGAYLNFVLAAVVSVSFKEASADVYVGTGLTILLGVSAVENLLSMIFEVYRPRVTGRQSRLLYQSRLIGLIAKPENLFTTAGQILDYQFGFRVSETWGYQFLRERLGVIIGLQVILLWLSTSIVVIEPSVRGKLVDGAQKRSDLLKPGIHLKLPWPFASVERFYPDQVHTFHVGLEPLSEDELKKLGQMDRPGLWLEPTGKDYDSKKKTGELFFLTGSGDETVGANLMVASVPVQYRIRSGEENGVNGLEDGWLRFSDPEQLLRNIATREVVAYFLAHDFEELLIKGRKSAQETLRNNIQQASDKLGVEILFVGVADLRPPAESPDMVVERGPSAPGEEDSGLNPMPVAAAFEGPVTAGLVSEITKFNAQQEKLRLAAEQDSEVELIEYGATVASDLLKMQAKARAESQLGARKPFTQAPNTYPVWLYLTTFVRAVEQARKFVVAAQNHEIELDLDLHEAIRRGMTDIKVPEK